MGNVGSYLTIRNDTADVWQVKIGPDEAAIQVVTIVASVLGAITGVAGAFGAFAGLAAFAAGNGVLIMGISAGNLAAFTAAAASVAAASGIVTVGTGFSSAVIAVIQSQLIKEGYLTLAPGE